MSQKTQLAAEAAKFSHELSEFLLLLRSRATGQFEYNLENNIPRGGMKLSEAGQHALRRGIIAAVSTWNEFGVGETLETCGDLLEDVNAHTEAAMIRDLAKKETAS